MRRTGHPTGNGVTTWQARPAAARRSDHCFVSSTARTQRLRAALGDTSEEQDTSSLSIRGRAARPDATSAARATRLALFAEARGEARPSGAPPFIDASQLRQPVV